MNVLIWLAHVLSPPNPRELTPEQRAQEDLERPIKAIAWALVFIALGAALLGVI